MGKRNTYLFTIFLRGYVNGCIRREQYWMMFHTFYWQSVLEKNLISEEGKNTSIPLGLVQPRQQKPGVIYFQQKRNCQVTICGSASSYCGLASLGFFYFVFSLFWSFAAYILERKQQTMLAAVVNITAFISSLAFITFQTHNSAQKY